MKREASVRYPNSANLFQFCRRVLDHKFGGVRVIDQDVGQILGFDPADCSHWKKGKKNIRSIQAIKSIADHLQIDERLIVDVASGDLNDLEAFYEFSSYQDTRLDAKFIEQAKKDYYRRGNFNAPNSLEQFIREAFSLREDMIDAQVATIQARLDFKEPPLYLPEISVAYPEIQVRQESRDTEDVLTRSEWQGSLYIISYPKDEKMRPFMRHQLAKSLAHYFLKHLEADFGMLAAEHKKLVTDTRANLFAAKLLAPAHLVRAALPSLNTKKDIVTQLAEQFWVSKNFMNHRLADILQKNPSI